MRRIVSVVAATALVSSSSGQINSYLILTSNVITPDSPSATIEVWSTFDPQWYAFNGADFDILAAADPGDFSNPERILKGPGSKNGQVGLGGDSVDGILANQLHFPSSAGIFADTANPILIWKATWSTSDFSPREVDLRTLTRGYAVYVSDQGNNKWLQDEPSFGEAFGKITVVPASGAAAVLPVAVIMKRRRR